MNRNRRRGIGRAAVAAAAAALLVPVAGCADGPAVSKAGAITIVPLPDVVTTGPGGDFTVTASTPVRAEGGTDAQAAARVVAAELHLQAADGSGPGITFRLDPAAGTRPEGYTLTSGSSGVLVSARDAAGLFYGGQTLRQLLPDGEGHGTVQSLRIDDAPRYAYRGAGLDIARHFFTVAQVEQYVDVLALYKFNHLHLHLTDDQGWRIAVTSRPQLTAVGASTQVGGGPGGSYTAADYRALVQYAAARHITVVPELDLPGHTNAAIVSYPELSCPGDPKPAPYTGTGVGFSRVCTGKEATYRFVDDVVAAVARLTPGPLIHLGGDETKTLAPADYQSFMRRAIAVGRAHGKQVVAWDEAAAERPDLLQVWHPRRRMTGAVASALTAAARHGSQLLMSPADHAYLDQKYDASTSLGLDWAGFVGVRQAYDWNPDTYLPGTPPHSVAGLEAFLWTETLATPRELQLMDLPRLPALAEVAWTPQSLRSWDSFRLRLAAQAPLWQAQGWAFTRADGVPWQTR